MTDLMPTNIDQTKVLATLGINQNDPKAHALLLVCQRYDLDPLLKHIQIVQNQTYVTRDGYLHVAHKSGRFDGMVTEYEKETDKAFEAKVSVFRRDMSHPFTAIGRARKNENNAQDMALARAERRALKRAFNVAGVSEHDVEWEQVPDISTSDGGVHQVELPAKAETHQFDEPEVEFIDATSSGGGIPAPVEAEVPQHETSARSFDGPPITDAQLRHIFKLLPDTVNDDNRHEYIGALIDRDISSFNELTVSEASHAIELLKEANA